MDRLKYGKFLYSIKKIILWYLLIFIMFANLCACKKLVEIPPPESTMTTEQVFATDSEAESAAASIYSGLIQGDNSFASYATTVFCGLSADELTIPATKSADWLQFFQNNLFAGNSYISNIFWANVYEQIYKSNAIIGEFQNNTAVKDSIKRELLGEAKFIRAFCNFYLVNLFGPVPKVTTINWRKTNTLSRAPISEIYQQIVADLVDAKELLGSDYSVGKGERIIPNKTAASALLARVYLYLGSWPDADAESTKVIQDPELVLETLPNVFKYNSKEAIWQLKQNNTGASNNVTPEGYFIRPRVLNSNQLPVVWITNSLLEGVQSGDQRKTTWIDSTKYSLDGKWYYFPGKYKQGPGQAVPRGPYLEYYMVLRLAEQYLIRAEARLKQNELSKAIEDINIIRRRAGLGEISNSLSSEEVMATLVKEKQIEFFAEWGHRWFDLKRWGIADKVLSLVKGQQWQQTDKLFPIPQTDLARNSNLVQNEGY